MPRLQGSLVGLESSREEAHEHLQHLRTVRQAALNKAAEDYAAKQATPAS